ncbi:MAG TPA: pyrroline-5-carboxylate reductase dimerization domain-containing protein [Candidatus Norongarragalinales archaeon]|nr:pyrroline-5-carboxylate reductase dimerization domain-containing protein [Candidatus Norongarragalinales archaeon]
MASIAIIGANGKMGSLICGALREAGEAHEVNAVVRRGRGRISRFEGSRFRITTDARRAISSSDIAILCLKPDQFEGWLKQNGSAISRDKPLLSCMTGFSPDRLAEMTSARNVAQFMPSIVMEHGRIFLPVAFGSNLAPTKKFQIRRVLSGFGKVQVVHQNEMPKYTLVSMAPALFSSFIDSLAVNSGIPREHALSMLIESMPGTSAMLRSSDPTKVIAKARTPGGWTDVALTTLEGSGLNRMSKRMFDALKRKHVASGWLKEKKK